MSLFLGLDSSTQSLTAIVIEVSDGGERRVVFEHSFQFDTELPEYGTTHGVLPNDDAQVVHSPPALWVAALDHVMEFLARESEVDLKQIRAVAGSGQQHGSVYLNASATGALSQLDPRRPLVEQIGTIFSRPTSPIWMDSSTSQECREITDALRGPSALADLTGSRAFERFTGPQIRKFYHTEPEAYANTTTIHLVSSFLATLLCGEHAAIDPGDGAGMNLMDLRRKAWAPAALDATAPGLQDKLPPVKESSTIAGRLSSYWAERFGFSTETLVALSSGDNPCSLIGVGLVASGRIAISLGTSDTLFGFLPQPVVDSGGRGHVFGSPTGDYMSLICFLNGSLAREQIRDAAGYSWDDFERVLGETPPGNRGRVLLPWFAPEITPHVPESGVRRYGLDDSDGPGNVRAVVEAQMMAMANHSEWMGVEVDTIYATGGAASNRGILTIMADVHGANVYQLEVGNSAALGAALRAFQAFEVACGRGTSWDEVIRDFVTPLAESRIAPDPERVELYRELRRVYTACEEHALGRGEDPASFLARYQDA
ncbi:MAG: carbohydrate kinase [Planctomycetes bacterium]|nr:carbohydrate kinase [Planctomycetota bacterium]